MAYAVMTQFASNKFAE